MASHLVSQHQLSSYATPINGAAGDATVVLGNDNTTVAGYNSHDSDGTIHVQSSSAAVFAATPAGTEGRKWMTQDAGAVYLYLDTGSAWVEVNYLRTASTGAVVITSTTTPQLTVRYDASNHLQVSVSSAGAVTFNASGASAAFTFSDAVTLSAALTYGGVTLTNAVTGTGNMVLSASPTFTGTVATAAFTASGLITGSAGVTVASGQTLTLTGATVAGQPTWSSTQAMNVSGSAATLTTTRTIWGQNFNGSANVSGAFSGATTGDFSSNVTIGGTLGVTGAVTGGTYNGQDIDATANFTGTVTVATGLTVSAGTTAVQALTATTAVFNPSATENILIGRAANATAYGMISLNGTLTTTNAIGFYARDADKTLYSLVPAAGTYEWRVADAAKMTLSASGALVLSAGITATTGTFSDNLGTATTKKIGLNAGLTSYLYESSASILNLIAADAAGQFNVAFNGTTALSVDLGSVAANSVGLVVYDKDNGGAKRVLVGAADSGGAGFRLLRVAN